MNWSFDFAPLFSQPVLWLAGLIAAGLVGMLFWRRTRGAWLRALAVAVLFLALFNPTLKQEERNTLANVAIVVVDESTSQKLAHRPAQVKAIRDSLEEKLSGVKNLEVKWVTASPTEGQTNTSKGSGTQLFAALNRALANTPPDRIAGVIMITDGQIHDIPKSTEALGFNAPVHTLLTGAPNEFDRRIEIVKAPKFGIVGQTREIEVRVRETGSKARDGGLVTLNVRREDQPDEQVQTSIDELVRIKMQFPHSGTNILEVELDAADGELTPANNRVVVAAEGVRENLRVLLVSGKPHAGERTWRNLLKSDAAVDLVHFTILRPPEKQDGTPINQLSLIAFPTRELFSQRIKDFDLIIFDRYQVRGILQMLYYDNIARYVEEHGGAVLVAAGDDYASRTSLYRTPLSTVLPGVPTGRVLEEPFKARITEDGDKHPVTQNLPGAKGPGNEPTWGRWFRQVDIDVRSGRSLMTGAAEKPLLVLDRRGKGRVALLTSDHAWLWARGFEGGGPHTDLLRRLAHWAMKEPDLEEERLTASARGLSLSIERRTMEQDVGPVTLKGPGGDEQQLTLEQTDDNSGVWRTTIEVKLPGLYKAQTQAPDRTLTAVAHAGAKDAKEMSEVTATPEKMEKLISATGGGNFWTRTKHATTDEDASDVNVPRISVLANAKVLAGSGWLGLRDQEAYLTKGVKLTPLFDGFLALAALLALLSLTWWREGR